MSEPFLGEIKMVGFNFPPRGWADCDGQLLSISQNQALFALLGASYGGNGTSTFGLPDLRGRFPMHEGSGPGLSSRSHGQKAGSEEHTLNSGQMPTHNHTGTIVSSSAEGDRSDPAGAYPARAEEPLQPYAGSTGSTMAPGSVSVGNAGGGLAIDHMPPFQVIRFVIALVGIFPSRD